MTDAESELRDRVTVRVPPAFIDGFDTLVDGGYYRSHAAVCRAAMRRFLIAHPAVDIPSADLDVELATGGNENVPDGTVAKELAEADPDDLMTDGGTDVDVETVWVARGGGGRDGTRRFHADTDCEGLAHSHRTPRAVPRDRVPEHWRPCGYCIGDYERTGSTGPSLADALASEDVTSVADLDEEDLVTDGGTNNGERTIRYEVTLAPGSEEYRAAAVREHIVESGNVHGVERVDDHRLDGAEPDDQPAAPPWADDEGGDA